MGTLPPFFAGCNAKSVTPGTATDQKAVGYIWELRILKSRLGAASYLARQVGVDVISVSASYDLTCVDNRD